MIPLSEILEKVIIFTSLVAFVKHTIIMVYAYIGESGPRKITRTFFGSPSSGSSTGSFVDLTIVSGPNLAATLSATS